MDSDDYLPRIAPRPSYAPAQMAAVHLVPEVSLMFDKPKASNSSAAGKSQQTHAVVAQVEPAPGSPTTLPFVNFSSWRNFQMQRQVHFENNNEIKVVPKTMQPSTSKAATASLAMLSLPTLNDEPKMKKAKSPMPKLSSSPKNNVGVQTAELEQPTITCSNAVDMTMLLEMIEAQNLQIKVLHEMMEMILNEMAKISEKQQQPEQSMKEDKGVQCTLHNGSLKSSTRRSHKKHTTTTHQHSSQQNQQQRHRFDNCLYRNECTGSSQASHESSTSSEETSRDDEKNFIHFYGGMIGQNKIMELPCTSGGATSLKKSHQSKIPTDFLAALPPAQTDRSLAMNTLALKYLPEDKLNQLIGTGRGKVFASNDMSMATYRYMEKFSLLNNDGKSEERNVLRADTRNSRKNPEMNKFLDVSAIKRQPKLI